MKKTRKALLTEGPIEKTLELLQNKEVEQTSPAPDQG